jgi:pyridoxine 5'-phosphate synthase PdxJ
VNSPALTELLFTCAGDRRHIQDNDLKVLRDSVTTYLNMEMAATEEMLKVALDTRPDAVSLVAENPNEVTTEGGWMFAQISRSCGRQ